MKKLFVSALAMLAVALGFTACSSDDELVNETPQGQNVTVIASTEEDGLALRTALEQDGDKYKVVWSEGDKISVGGNLFTLTSGAGTTNGTFEGIANLKESFYDVYYPATYRGTTATWPTDQDYVENNIPQGVPMKANVLVLNGQVISGKKLGDLDDGGVSGSSIKFYNEGGILRLNLKGTAKVASIKISATNLTNDITLNCGDAVQLNSETATPFHIAVPATDEGTDYNNLKITFYDENGFTVCTKTAKSDITVKRSMITDINLDLTASNFEHTYVELAGTKWATVNVGAVADITPKGTPHATYGYLYTQANAVSAAASWGSNWALPTKAQWEALLKEDNCTWSWQESYSFGGKTMNGCLVTDKNNGNSIFLPAAGANFGSTQLQGEWCFYKSADKDENGWSGLSYRNSSWGNGMERLGSDDGHSVRLVFVEN